jgi:NADPH:quinone reductase-like Zn-dependent oxidoreductase
MRAIIHDRYGPIETLECRDIASPMLGGHDVLIGVRAAGLHVGDLFAVRGSPFPVRAMTGMRRPKYGVPGFDLAGIVIDVGSAVTRVKVGDDVFGVGDGTAAECARAGENDLAPMPAGLTHEEAAAIPTSALAALHGLRDAGRLQPGQKVLINGASGGVGTFAVQIAKALGAHVTGVASTSNLELIRSLGADEAIDYTREDFTRRNAGWDLILDNVENRSMSDVRRALTPTGTLVLNSGTGSGGLRMLIRLASPIVRSWFSSQNLRRYISNPNHADLVVLKELVESGKLRPVIDRTYALDDTVDALRHIATGHARGKVVLSVAPA